MRKKTTGKSDSAWLLSALVAALLLVACGAGAVPPNGEPPPTVPVPNTPEVENAESEEGDSVIETPDQPDSGDASVELAVADLSQRLGIPASEIDVAVAERVVWPDASIGCPEPDMMYAQVLQDGVRIVLEAAGERYHYHGGGAQELFLCESPQAAPEGTPFSTTE